MALLTIHPGTLVVLVGAPGIGKSTWAEGWFQSTEVVSSDHCRALICDDETNQKVSGATFQLFDQIINARLTIGRTTVADATNTKRGRRSKLIDLAHLHNRRVVAVFFQASSMTHLLRNGRRKRVVNEAPLLQIYHQLDGLTEQDLREEGFDDVRVVNANNDDFDCAISLYEQDEVEMPGEGDR